MPGNYVGKQTTMALGLGATLATMTTPTKLLLHDTQNFNRINPKARFQQRKGRPAAGGQTFAPQSVSDHTTSALGGEMDLNDILLPLLTGVSGAPTIAVATGLENTMHWTFAPDSRTIPAIQFATMQWRQQDTSATAQTRTLQAHKGFCQNFNITAQGVGLVSANANYMLGSQYDVTTPTDLDAHDDTLAAPVKLSAFGVWDSWDAMVAGEPAATNTIGYNTAYTTGHKALTRNDGVLDYLRTESDMRGMTMGMSIYDEHGTSQLQEVENNHREENELRFVKMRFKSLDTIETTEKWRIFRESANVLTTVSGGAISGTTLTPPTDWTLNRPASPSDPVYTVEVFEHSDGDPHYGPITIDTADATLFPAGYLGEIGQPFYLDVGMAAYHTDDSLQTRGQVTDGDFHILNMNYTLATDEEEEQDIFFRLQTNLANVNAYLAL